MSNVTSPETGNTHRSNEGLRQDDPVEVDSLVNVDIANDGSEEGEILDDLPVGTKRKHSPSVEEQPSPERNKPAPEQSGISFGKLWNPPQKLPCIISVDQREPIGKLYCVTEGFRIMAFIDAGRYGPPSITLDFSTNRTKKAAKSKWDTASDDEGRCYAMSNIEYGSAPINGSDPIISHPKVLNLCEQKDEGKLMYLRFRSWDQTKGFRSKAAFRKESKDIKRLVKSILFPEAPYEVMLWFIAPVFIHEFHRYCLSFFRESEKQRVHPLCEYKDVNGVYFGDMPKLQAPKSIAYKGPGKPAFRTIKGQKEPLETITTGIAHFDAAKDAVPDGGLVNSEEEKSTAEPSSAAPPLEKSLSTAALDTEMPKRSPSLPTEDEESDVSSSDSEIQPAASGSIFDIANTGNYVPPEYLEDSA